MWTDVLQFPREERVIGSWAAERQNSRNTELCRGELKTLAGNLQIHCVDEPFQLCSVDISERKLNAVKPEDFKVFENVAYIDASINSLSLGSFGCFAALRELNLSLNGICNMTFDVASFPHLEVLDLSYNSLSPEGILSLGRLPRLKALHLTGNQLRHLPPDLGSPQLPTEGKPFGVLEALMLDDNKLSSGVFHSLTNLQRLKYLNLQRNNISEISYMQVTSSLKRVQISVEEEAHTDVNLNIEERLKVLKSFHADGWEENCSGSSLPLPKLQVLNLAENQIAKEEALIVAAVFPMLREIDIHSNPLTIKRRGIPTAVRMLENSLRNLNVHRDSKPKLDSIQTPYRERKKKTQILPLLRPLKQSDERVDEMIEHLRKKYTNNSKLLRQYDTQPKRFNREEYEEALSSLRIMKSK
ncbi:X-ray radiation resistance-associated protein 1 [Xenentodon cancila]